MSRSRLLTGGLVLSVSLLASTLPAVLSGDAVLGSTAAERPRAADLDVLFVGAHPDDESFALSTYGQWNEDNDLRTGVITITRGEGGGNAVGPQEGPALGLIREAEERRAVAKAGIRDVYNLDEVDFFYTVSAALTEQVWGHGSTLRKVVRIVRETRPEVIVTMDPAPSPGNHGNHQYAGRMALEAFDAAADPTAFPAQLTRERLRTWAADTVLLGSARGTPTGTGPDCGTAFDPERPTQDLYGVWDGTASQRWDTTWAQVEREAQREYRSQGWAVFPDVPTDPADIGCDWFTRVDSRVPYVRGDRGPDTVGPATVLRGALLRQPGGLPLGTRLSTDPEPFAVAPGGETTLTVAARGPASGPLGPSRLTVRAPDGWSVDGAGPLGWIGTKERVVREVTLTAPADAATNRQVLVAATLRAGDRQGSSWAELEVTPPVLGTQQLLPQVRQFQAWATTNGYPQLQGFVEPVLPLASGGSRQVRVQVTNNDSVPHSGEVALDLPDGFAAEPASRPYSGLAAGDSTRVAFTVTNTDASLPTSNAGGDEGDYDYSITTAVDGVGASSTTAALELVPTTAIRAGAAPTVDGAVGAGEYSGQPLDLSRLWEGEACESAADCSATGHLTRHGDRLFVGVEVTDDTLGTPLARSDCKRHWRTDSVEIAIDPSGDSENTVSTFKMAVLPRTAGSGGGGAGGPCYLRDADHHQGPGPQTAPGVDIGSSTTGDGWVIEASIPARELPGTVDADAMGLNLFVYDSDTQDLTGQTRIGWSTWGGVQGDPYRWGVARLPGWDPPEVEAGEPVIPSEALSSLRSPQSIAQAARTGVALAGGPAARPGHRGWLVGPVTTPGNDVRVHVRAQDSGVAHLFVYDPDSGTVAKDRVRLGPGTHPVRIRIDGGIKPSGDRVLLGWEAAAGTWSSAARVP